MGRLLRAVEAIASRALRLQIDFDDVVYPMIAAHWARTPALPALRTLVLLNVHADVVETVSRIGPAVTTLELLLSSDDADSDDGSEPFDALHFGDLAARRTLQRVVVRDGGYWQKTMVSLPALAHLEVGVDDAER